MNITTKIIPKLYQYLKLTGKSSLIETKNFNGSIKGLTFSTKLLDNFKYSEEELLQASRDYQKSPYINHYLRSNQPLDEKSNELVLKLKQLIHKNNVTGSFVRGITPCKNMPAITNEESVAKYIFNNKGFTSTSPIKEQNYANMFSSRYGATVIFDIKKTIPAYQTCNVEVLFDTNTFTADKYKIIKVKDNIYKVIEK